MRYYPPPPPPPFFNLFATALCEKRLSAKPSQQSKIASMPNEVNQEIALNAAIEKQRGKTKTEILLKILNNVQLFIKYMNSFVFAHYVGYNALGNAVAH